MNDISDIIICALLTIFAIYTVCMVVETARYQMAKRSRDISQEFRPYDYILQREKVRPQSPWAGQVVLLEEDTQIAFIEKRPQNRCPYTGVIIKDDNATADERLNSQMHG